MIWADLCEINSDRGICDVGVLVAQEQDRHRAVCEAQRLDPDLGPAQRRRAGPIVVHLSQRRYTHRLHSHFGRVFRRRGERLAHGLLPAASTVHGSGKCTGPPGGPSWWVQQALAGPPPHRRPRNVALTCGETTELRSLPGEPAQAAPRTDIFSGIGTGTETR